MTTSPTTPSVCWAGPERTRASPVVMPIRTARPGSAGGEHAQGAAHRPFGVVLVGGGGAEHGHDAVADELVQGAAEAFDLGPQAGVVGAQQGADVLGVGLVGPGGEPHQVAEQHRDQASFLGRGLGRAGEGRPAGPAEPEAPGLSCPQTTQRGMGAVYGPTTVRGGPWGAARLRGAGRDE